jgi:hypothetical protein
MESHLRKSPELRLHRRGDFLTVMLSRGRPDVFLPSRRVPALQMRRCDTLLSISFFALRSEIYLLHLSTRPPPTHASLLLLLLDLAGHHWPHRCLSARGLAAPNQRPGMAGARGRRLPHDHGHSWTADNNGWGSSTRGELLLRGVCAPLRPTFGARSSSSPLPWPGSGSEVHGSARAPLPRAPPHRTLLQPPSVMRTSPSFWTHTRHSLP